MFFFQKDCSNFRKLTPNEENAADIRVKRVLVFVSLSHFNCLDQVFIIRTSYRDPERRKGFVNHSTRKTSMAVIARQNVQSYQSCIWKNSILLLRNLYSMKFQCSVFEKKLRIVEYKSNLNPQDSKISCSLIFLTAKVYNLSRKFWNYDLIVFDDVGFGSRRNHSTTIFRYFRIQVVFGCVYD